MFKKWIRDDSGATAIEYALIAGFIALAIITGVTAVGTTLNTKFTSLNDKLQ